MTFLTYSYDLQSSREDGKRLLLGTLRWSIGILESDVSSMYSLENTIHHKTKVYGKQKVT